jgi:two-component system nitrogen regulation response regulator GlnG
LVDDNKGFFDDLKEQLEHHGYEVQWRESAEMLSAPAVNVFDVLLLDQRLPRKSGLELLQELRRQGVQAPVILITEHGTPDAQIEANLLGVFEFLAKPLDMEGPALDELRRALDRAVQASQMRKPVLLPVDPGSKGTRLVGLAAQGPMSEVYTQIGVAAAAARRDNPVLILGETGTGKDLIARVLFQKSDRKTGPFLRCKCAAFHEKELEEELFGYRGSDRQKIGAFEKADGGALVLDDLGETSRAVQAKIVRAITEGLVICGGTGKEIQTDVWVIGCDLRPIVSELYFQFRTKIHLPRLHDRGPGDLDLLADHFLEQAAAEDKAWVTSFHEQARTALRRYHWPGNVRELQQVIRTAVLLCRGPQVTAADLRLGPAGCLEGEVSAYLQRAIRAASRTGRAALFPFLRGALERELVLDVWIETDGSLEETARRVGLAESDVRRILQEIGITPAAPDHSGERRPLPPSREKAWRLYLWAQQVDPALAGAPCAKIFHWLATKLAREGEGRQGLPEKCESFERYVREASAHYRGEEDGSRP